MYTSARRPSDSFHEIPLGPLLFRVPAEHGLCSALHTLNMDCGSYMLLIRNHSSIVILTSEVPESFNVMSIPLLVVGREGASNGVDASP